MLTPHRIAKYEALRVAQGAVVGIGGGDSKTRHRSSRRIQFGIINVHLSPHDHGDDRQTEKQRSSSTWHDDGSRLPVIAGDCNDAPDGPGPSDVCAAGWADAWALDRLGESSTVRRTGRLGGDSAVHHPSVSTTCSAPSGWVVVDAAVLAAVERFDWFAARSDHLPVLAVLEPPEHV